MLVVLAGMRFVHYDFVVHDLDDVVCLLSRRRVGLDLFNNEGLLR